MYKVMAFLGTKRGIVVALSLVAAVLNAKGHPGYGFGEGTF